MSLKQGARIVPSHQGNFGQTRASRFAKFSGILQNKPFLEGLSLYRQAMEGKAGMAPGLAKTKAGYKHKGGMSEEHKQELEDLRKTVDAQNDKILELEDKVRVEPEPVTPTPAPDEHIAQVDEGTFGE